MNILVISGGSGNDALIKGLKSFYPELDVKVLVNAYDNGKSTGVCRYVTDTLGVSDIRKNHTRMYKAMTPVHLQNKCLLEFYDKRYDLTKGKEADEVIQLLDTWGLNQLSAYAISFFNRPQAEEKTFNDFAISNIIYAEMYAEHGYEYTNKYFAELLGIDDFVILNSFDNVYIEALTERGKIIEDEGDIVEHQCPWDRIVGIRYAQGGVVKHQLNPEAIKAIDNADMIVISTGTFWSSIFPTLDYLDLYKYINNAKCKKLWCMNNNQDKDAYAVTSTDFIRYVENLGLNLSDFSILINSDAEEELQKTDEKHKFIIKSMGNHDGKHDGGLYAQAVLEYYYGLSNLEFNHIMFDFDDTIWSRDYDTDKEAYEISGMNTRLLVQLNRVVDCSIISGNSFESIAKKLRLIYGSNFSNEFKLDIWADANAVLYKDGEARYTIPSSIIDAEKADTLMKKLYNNYGIMCYPNPQYTCLKMKPYTGILQRVLADYLTESLLNSCGLKDCVAKTTGRSTVDIVTVNNCKTNVLEQYTIPLDKILYIGDEIDSGNDREIAEKVGHAIKTKDVNETNAVLRILLER